MYARINVELMDIDGDAVEDTLSDFYNIEFLSIRSSPKRIVSSVNSTTVITDPLRGVYEREEEIYALFIDHKKGAWYATNGSLVYYEPTRS